MLFQSIGIVYLCRKRWKPGLPANCCALGIRINCTCKIYNRLLQMFRENINVYAVYVAYKFIYVFCLQQVLLLYICNYDKTCSSRDKLHSFKYNRHWKHGEKNRLFFIYEQQFRTKYYMSFVK